MQLRSDFDPYHKWLSIPLAEQPPTLYRLLGLSAGEADAEVIDAAADRQMAYLRTLQLGQYASEAARLLSEVAAARLCLLDPVRRANYDAVLRGAAPASLAEAHDDGAPTAQPVRENYGPPLLQAQPQPVRGQETRAQPGQETRAQPGTPAQSVAPVQPAAFTQRPARPISVEPAQGTFGTLDLLATLRTTPLAHVYRARYRPTGRIVTLKTLPPAALGQREIVARFEREQKLTTTLRHRNLIEGLAAGALDGVPFLVTEYVEGTDLARLVGTVGPLPVADAVAYCVQTAGGLMQLHLHGVYHRNIKPHVLLVDRGGQIKITNLFLAKLDERAALANPGEALTQMGQGLGTFAYTAPEQARDARIASERSDMYSLGCTLHYLLTGSPPFRGKSVVDKIKAHLTQPPPSLRAARGDVPRRLDEVFARMLAKEPAARLRDLDQVADALEQAVRPNWLTRWKNRLFKRP